MLKSISITIIQTMILFDKYKFNIEYYNILVKLNLKYYNIYIVLYIEGKTSFASNFSNDKTSYYER